MTRVLIVAHGQPGDPEPQQQAVETLAARIAPHLPQAQVGGATLAMPGALNIFCSLATKGEVWSYCMAIMLRPS